MGVCTSGLNFDEERAKEDFSEILPDKLYLSSLACANYGFLARKKVSAVVSIGNEVLESKRDLRVKQIVIEDNPNARICEHIDKTCAFIHLHVRHGKVLVHCEQGRSRSATIVLAYLIRYQKMTLEEAYNFVQTKRWISPNIGFIGALLQFEREELLRRNGVNHRQKAIQPSTVFVAKYMMDALLSPEAVEKHKISVPQIVEALEDSNFDAKVVRTQLLQKEVEAKETPRPSA
mmetsp:Transcript_10114/g.20064  ORF Transcript_10114/g.20064 Transcript_10114/m.20064 type:complete len:233 (-) Transcript_10114:307-1005(-)|eukprot:CAMPEP_0167815828 /NCGR_PEP_ID=MMETSP0112_2-20121227/3241_1 /TAXON_ID=91324 /ORGANISM="Lotharella globosa, Strain CCCM811" /LENGTH=232 /DNA_ID=CAMNT_0007715295 /DNA_START=47 /DNA_END=745 /DNA_ORIENTATION=-